MFLKESSSFSNNHVYLPTYQQGSSLITDFFFFHSCRGSIDINNSAAGVLKEPTEAEKIPPEIQAETK